MASGIRFVLNNQQTNGLLASRNNGGAEMYYHGICTLMLAEVVGMTDGKQADELKKRAAEGKPIYQRFEEPLERDGKD